MLVDRKLPTPAKPIIFLKATSSYIQVGEKIQVFLHLVDEQLTLMADFLLIFLNVYCF